MRVMKKAVLSSLMLCVLVVTGAAQSTTTPRPYDAAREKRLEWFRDVRYGMFIHWGLDAIPAGEWKGQRSLGIGEWIQNRLKIPVRDYEQLTKHFNPTKYNPDEWVQLAQDAGMKYIVITSKQHDGFALFKSAVIRYNVGDATPYKKDIPKQLAEVCEKRGMRLGFGVRGRDLAVWRGVRRMDVKGRPGRPGPEVLGQHRVACHTRPGSSTSLFLPSRELL